MKRNLIAIAIASMGLATTGAFAHGDRMYQQQGDSGASSTSPSALGSDERMQPGVQSSQGSEQSAQDSEIVRQVQTALSYEGYDPGPIDGQLSSQTQDALKQAQHDKGLSETGQIDSQTLAALGMGDLGPTTGSSSSSSSSSGLSSAFPESGGSEANGGMNGSLPS
ncbi:MAG TPA: peptidoglycan-binding domain-containing protein [Burkholderiales bacterium]|nr:peptidoglycan-binding domain-containing protein [Burkholderiales bacterium]